MKRFTDTWLRNLKPKAKLYEYREGDGFSVRIQPSGTKTFYYIYADAGKKQRVRIGEYGAMSLLEAREKAASLHSTRKSGTDLKLNCSTIAELAERYLKEHSQTKNTPRVYKEAKRIMEKDILPKIGMIELDKIKRQHIYDLLKQIIDRGAPIQSNSILKVLKKMFNFGIERGITEINPAHKINEQQGNEKTRVLSDKEIASFLYGPMKARTTEGTMRCLKLTLITGQRPGECLNMLHEEIDGDWWTIPKEKTKNQKRAQATDHRVFLSPFAKEMIGSGSGPVFPSPTGVSALGTALRRLRNRIDIAPFAPHDLRRTAATNIAELGYSQDVIDRILGHMLPKIARTYNRYSYDKEKQQVMLAWEEKLKTLSI